MAYYDSYEGDLPPNSPLRDSKAVKDAIALNKVTSEVKYDSDKIPGMLDPIATIPGVSDMSIAIGNASRAIDEILPTTSLDPYIPNVETIANFTPGVGDLTTGEYSALDILGLGLDVFGLGAGADALKARKLKYKKGDYAANKNSNQGDYVTREIYSPTGRPEDVRYTPEYMAERRLRDHDPVASENLWAQQVEEFGIDNLNASDRARYSRWQETTAGASESEIRQAILNRNAQARTDIAGGTVPTEASYNPSPEMRARLDEIGAPSNREIARINAELQAGVIPEGMVDSLQPAALRQLNDAAEVSTRLTTKLDNINYADFNIDDFQLFKTVGEGNFDTVSKRFYRGDKSNTNVIVNIQPGGRKGQVHIELREGGKTLPTGQLDRVDDANRSYFSYNIEEIATDAGDYSRIHGIMFYSRGGGTRGAFEASRLFRDALNHAPKNAMFDESNMTMDALYLALKEMVKRPNAKFHIDPTRTQSSGASTVSRPSKLAHQIDRGHGGEGARDEIIQIFVDLEEQLIKQGKIKKGETLNLRDRFGRGSVRVAYNPFTVTDFKAVAPLMLGFDDWEEMSKHLDDGDDIVNSVIDMEKGIF